jgi:Flp pilus assembly protein TadG
MAQIRKLQATTHLDGTVAIEYGLILPALMLFTLGIMDTGRLLWTLTTLSRATEAAARCAAVNNTVCGTTSQIQTYAAAQAWGLNDVTPSVFAVTNPLCGVQVSVTYTFQFIIPWIGPSTPLNAAACYLPQFP